MADMSKPYAYLESQVSDFEFQRDQARTEAHRQNQIADVLDDCIRQLTGSIERQRQADQEQP